MTSETRNVIVRIEFDSDTECPHDWDCQWRLYSFSTKHIMFKHPSEFANLGIRNKLRAGTAFALSYFEHGDSLWMLKHGHHPAGVEFMWDGVRDAGILVWEHPISELGPKTYEDRAKDAQMFLDIWNDWANGRCFWYSIEDAETGEFLDSCGGYIGRDHLLNELGTALAPYNVVEVTGEASSLVNEEDLNNHADKYREKVREHFANR